VDPLPEHPGIDENVPHAPVRTPDLTLEEKKLALKNALRYFPKSVHSTLVPEFAKELEDFGHIYMYRFRPTAYEMKAYPIDDYPAKTRQCAAIQVMIMNNLDKAVAQFPHELITYGGNGSAFQNWAQYHLVMKYLTIMTDKQTLTVYSGHPMGLYPSHPDAPRVVLTNGMMVPNFSTPEMYNKQYALGNTMYGQMTAGSYCYIGPQGIVHGTTLTLLNAGRKYLSTENLTGKVYVSSGLGGMSGAQGKASDISGLIGVIAEVDESALMKRYNQGWIQKVAKTPKECVQMICDLRKSATGGVSIGFLGNVVSLWEELADHAEKTGEVLVDLGSDQTSCHNPYNGGYYPVGLESMVEAQKMMRSNPEQFKKLVHESLRRHVAAINRLVAKGMYFWDYGNSFLFQASVAKADVLKQNPKDNLDFRYPSYFEDIMGDIFSLGFGPFRWVCTSHDPKDLALTDQLAAKTMETLLAELAKIDDQCTELSKVQENLRDNLKWINEAGKNKLVVGSEARILYSDAEGRRRIALAFNDAVESGQLKGPVVLSRDHHDVSGTDSPFRETANVTDGSMFCADMAVQNAIGDSFRGATYLALHNGGGTGWGQAMNGGFGLVLDGSKDAARRASSMLFWDVNNGVSRRSWGRNACAEFAIKRAMENEPTLQVTVPNHVDEAHLDKAFSS